MEDMDRNKSKFIAEYQREGVHNMYSTIINRMKGLLKMT